MPVNIRDLKISSDDFEPGGTLPRQHAKEHGNVPPRLRIVGVPEGTVDLAVVCHDPDAPMPQGFTHWTLYGIPPAATAIGPDADERYRSGPNGFGSYGYGGPRPPAGHGIHHYYFWVYALSRHVEGEPTREAFLTEYSDAIIEQNRCVGTFES